MSPEEARKLVPELRAIEGGGSERPAYTDLGNAETLVDRHGDRLRHVRQQRVWLYHHAGRWHRDETGEAERAAKDVARRALVDAAELNGEEQKAAVKWALQSQSEPRVRACLGLASTESEIALSADQLDADPYLLACPNGTVDLRTGELREHRPEDLISRGTEVAYDPRAKAPRWHRFLGEVFAEDEELIAFIKRVVGYCLTGDTREHVAFVFHGAGCNGKTVFTETIKHLLGDLAVTASFDSFVRSRGDRGPRNDLARLHRARLVTASESGEGRKLDEATVKTLSGGDTVTARFLYGEHFEFRPHFKLAMITNHRPRVDGDDDAIWRRLRLIPFEQSFEGREDHDLPAKLAAELPGILRWALGGCL